MVSNRYRRNNTGGKLAAVVGSIQVLFTVNHAAYERGVRSAASVTESAGQRMERSVKSVDRATQQMNRTMTTIRGREFRVLALSALRAQDSVERLRGSLIAVSALVGGFGAAFTLKGLMDYSDTYKVIGNRIRTVKGEAQDLAAVEAKIFDVAQRTRASYESTGVLFARIAGASKRLGVSQKDVLRVTETIQKAFVVGGSTQIEAAQSAIQLSQGIASNRLQGDELRSVLENPALGQLLADRISGGDLGKLREMASQGQLTAKVVIDAFKSASEEIDRLFNNTSETISQAFTKVDNALLRYIGTSGEINTASSAMVYALNALAENMDTVAGSLVTIAAGFAGLIGARAIGGFTSALGASIAATSAQNSALRKNAGDAMLAANAQRQAARDARVLAQQQYDAAKTAGALGVSQRDRVRLGRELQLAYQNEAAAARLAQQATLANNQVMMQTGRVASVASLAVRGLGAAMTFLGGPIGVALLAVGAGMAVLASRAQAAQERADRYAEAIAKAGGNSTEAAAKIREVSAALNEVAADTPKFSIQADLNKTQSDIEGISMSLRDMAFYIDVPAKLFDEFIAGKITIGEFRAGLNQASPGVAEMAMKASELAQQLEAARGKTDALRSALQNLDGTVVRVGIQANVTGSLNEANMMASLAERMSSDGTGGLEEAMSARAAAAEYALAEREKAAQKAEREAEKAAKAAEKAKDKLMTEAEIKAMEFQAAQDGINERNVQLAYSFRSLADEIVYGFREGASAIEVLSNVLDNLAGQFLDAGLNMLFQSLLPVTPVGSSASPLISSMISSGLGGLFHGGGTVGSGGKRKALSAAQIAMAPRFHSGLKSDEFAAVLQRGEQVLTKAQSGVAMSALDKVASGASSGRGDVYIDARGAQMGVGEEIKRALAEYDRQSYSRHVAQQNRATKRRAV
jgi:tape measure domain-containing protein